LNNVFDGKNSENLPMKYYEIGERQMKHMTATTASTLVGIFALLAVVPMDPGASAFGQLVKRASWVDQGSSITTSARVGIGTSNPTQILDVQSNGGAALRFRSATADAAVFLDTQPGVTSNIRFQEGGADRWVMSNRNQRFHLARTKNGNDFTIAANGNVGVGTSQPGEKFSVAGVIETQQGGIKFPDGTVQTSAATAAPASDGVIDINPGTFVYPYTITQPGTYRLMGDLQSVGPDRDAIFVDAVHVTIDLNGFFILGPNRCIEVGCTPSSIKAGIQTGNVYDLTVKNGTIIGFDHAISGADHITLKNLIIRLQGDDAVKVGDYLRVVDCTIIENREDGIDAGHSAFITGSVISDNRRSGIKVDDDSFISGCLFNNNRRYGVETVSTTSIANSNFNGNFTDPYLNGVALDSNVCDGAICN
jgi:hypothetical protein